MKRFSPADPAKFKPLEFPRFGVATQPLRNTRAMLAEQRRFLALPPPDKATRVLAGFVAFVVLL